MDILPDHKRLFFGFEVIAPWPENFPAGRLLAEPHRHLTLVFLGNIPQSSVNDLLVDIPKPHFKVGRVGYFEKCLFLPERHPHVVAWQGVWHEGEEEIHSFQRQLSDFVQKIGVQTEHRDRFLPHVTLCRAPFNISEWRHAFVSLPFYIKDLHLYESLGSLIYQPLWTHSISHPFEELEHTADIAFLVRAESISQLYLHAQSALAFHFPAIHSYFSDNKTIDSLDEVIIALNERVAIVDAEIGCPFKAISFHGHLKEKEGLLEWEMIVDV